MANLWVGGDDRDEGGMKLRVSARKFVRHGGKYRVNIPPIVKVMAAKKAGTKSTFCGSAFCKCFSDY
jgi:hypothetical protein